MSSASSSQPQSADDTRDWIRRADAVLAPTYKRPDDLLLSEGEGSWVVDAAGKRYLDLTSGIAVTSLGHRNPAILKALHEAAEGLLHTSNLYHTRPAVELAEALTSRSFADKVFFCNSGAEAAEGALKLARLAQGERRELLAFRGSFHGRTMGALATTDRPDYQRPFEPLAGAVDFLPWDDPDALEAIGSSTAAVIVEPIQGEGGIRVPREGFLAEVRRRCDQAGALLIFDEVQCGLGRTGRLWAHEHEGVTPDLMTLAKPLAGGLPMGAVLMTDAVSDAIFPGAHATTFGGGPFVAAVALAVVEALADEDLLANARARGAQLRKGFEALGPELVREVRGRGLILGVKATVPAADAVAEARRRGLLVVPAGDDVIRLTPPLTLDEEEARRGVELLAETLRSLKESGSP